MLREAFNMSDERMIAEVESREKLEAFINEVEDQIGEKQLMSAIRRMLHRDSGVRGNLNKVYKGRDGREEDAEGEGNQKNATVELLKIRLTKHGEERNPARNKKDEKKKKKKKKDKRDKFMFTRDIGDMNLRVLLYPTRINIAVICCRAQVFYSITVASLPSALRNYFSELPPIYKHLAAATIKQEGDSLSFHYQREEI